VTSLRVIRGTVLTVAIATAWLDSSAAGAAGPVIGWGAGAPTFTASAVAAGDRHSCAIQAGSGAVACWGTDYYGETNPPPSVDGTTGTATAIAAGVDHSCAIQAGSGKVVCWGFNYDGEATPPPSVDGTTGTAFDISAGYGHTLAIAAPEPDALVLGLASLGALALLARRRDRAPVDAPYVASSGNTIFTGTPCPFARNPRRG
jgi:Regulator of chromosome condensation (RCC1) repeat/PEP-CTERM motif